MQDFPYNINLLLIQEQGYLIDELNTILPFHLPGAIITQIQSNEELHFLLNRNVNVILFHNNCINISPQNLLSTIKELDPDLPCIYLTENVCDEVDYQFFDMGFNDVVPVTEINRLISVIKREYKNKILLQERKEALHSVQSNEELYRSLIEYQSGFIRKITPRGNFIYANQSYINYINQTRKEVYSQNLLLLLPSRSRDIYLRHLKNLTPISPSQSVEYYVLGKNGNHLIQVWVDYGLFDSMGRLQSIIGVGRDVTQERKLEEEKEEMNNRLRASEKDFRDMALNVPGVIFQFIIKGRFGRFSYISPKLHEILKIEIEKLKLNSRSLGIIKSDRKLFFEKLKTVFQKKLPINIETRIQNKEGRSRWIQFIASPVSKEDLIYNGVIIDITSRKDAEFRLQDQKQMFRSLFHFSPIGKAILDLDGGFFSMNEFLINLLGCEKEEIYYINIFNILPEEKAPLIKSFFQKRKKNNDLNIETEILKKDGSKKTVLLKITLLVEEHDKSPLFYILALVDITQRKLLEEKLVQSNKMESIGNLASGIAHDFNNLLQPLIMFSQIMREELEKAETEKEKRLFKYNSKINETAEKAKKIVGQILDFSRKSNNNHSKFNIVKTSKDSMNSILSSYPNEKILFQFHTSSEKYLVMGDPFSINQIFLNFYTNAIHAMRDSENKTIELEIKAVENTEIIQQFIPNSEQLIQLRFTDNGKGIEKEKINLIFEPFFTDKKHGEGTGLGLSIVYGIIKRMNGYIQVESEMKKGTSFYIYLPLLDENK